MNDCVSDFISKGENGELCVGIIGLGYVGLPLCLTFAQAGFKVVGFDIDQTRIDELNSGKDKTLEFTPKK